MLSKEANKALTEVSRGTPMGELLRRYWHPIAPTAELDDYPSKVVRLMGEDLVLYKDKENNYGLIGRYCPHRGADLSYATVENCGLRCVYHGWRFNHLGRCLEQPFEETTNPTARFKDRVKAVAYPVIAKAGLLWAYLGPEPAPLVPNWEPFTWKNGFVQVVLAEIPCNWLQCFENSIDPIHFEWLHANWSATAGAENVARRVVSRLTEGRSQSTPAPKHLKIAFDEFEYGFTYRRIIEGQPDGSAHWNVGRVSLWPNAFFNTRLEWFVPVDDTTTLIVSRHFDRVPKEQEPFEQKLIPYWYAPLKDPTTQRWIVSHPMNQDFAVMVGQGAIVDRSREHLGESDRGVIMLRQRLLDQIKVVAAGGEPKGLIRSPDANVCVDLPFIERDQILGRTAPPAAFGATPDGEPPDFYHLAGQPPDVRAAHLRAMGFKPTSVHSGEKKRSS